MRDPTRTVSHSEFIHDWNGRGAAPSPAFPVEINDETLRDGMQATAVTSPTVEEKRGLLELMQHIGVSAVSLGMPAAGPWALEEVVTLARHIREEALRLEPNCAARTLHSDIVPIVEAVQRAGQPIVVHTFIGSSPLRQCAEAWDLDFILRSSTAAIDFAVRQGLEVAFITEDTTRSTPETLELLFRAAVEHGASRLVLCDTVGHATPAGTRALVRWTRDLVERLGSPVKVEWHGHNDRGLALINALVALEAGATRVHGCGLGIGERTGNAPVELLLLNLKLLGWIDQDLTRLVDYVLTLAQVCRVPIPRNYPLVGEDAFRTATGVHSAAIIKALERGDDWLADHIYSSVPAGEFGRRQQLELGPMSGMSGVRYWLMVRGLQENEQLCEEILRRAKSAASTLTEEEVWSIVQAHGGQGRSCA